MNDYIIVIDNIDTVVTVILIGIKVDAYNKKDKCIGTALMVHEDLETAVGDSLAAFVHNLV